MYRSTMVHGKKWIIQSFAKGWHILCVLKTWKMCQSLANHCILITNQGRCFSVVQPGDILNPYRCFGVISFLCSLNSFWKATLNDLQNWRIQNQFIWLHRLQRKYHVFLSDFLGRQNGKPLSLLPIQRNQSVFAGNPIPEVYLMIPWIFTYNSIYVLSMTS